MHSIKTNIGWNSKHKLKGSTFLLINVPSWEREQPLCVYLGVYVDFVSVLFDFRLNFVVIFFPFYY